MSAEITIFEIPEVEPSTNKSQKEIEYDDLKKASKLSDYHFDSFYEMDLQGEDDIVPKSNIVSILCKYVIQYCLPVVLEDKEKYHITLQDERVVQILNANSGKYVVVPKNTQFRLSGVKIPTIFVRAYDRQMLSTFDHITNVDLANIGNYGPRDFQTRRFTQQRIGFTQPGLPNILMKNNIVYFSNEHDAVEKLEILIKYIVFMEKYYAENYRTLVADMSISPYTPNIVNDGQTPWMIKRDILTGALTNALLPSIDGEFGESFNYDLFLTLQQNNLMHAYHVGNVVGVDDKLFKKGVNARLEFIRKKKELETQLQVGHTLKLELAKKRSISVEKYNEMNLNLLDKKQLAVIELEYKKLEQVMNKNLSLAAKQNQKLFFLLRKSFLDVNDDRLKVAMNNIKKEITGKELTGDGLIEGGVCPHVYQKGETMLKHFGKPWLQTQLTKDVVQMYSLPEERNGYFCYICGEHLADADNEGEVRFVGGERVQVTRLDDPIQTMIWKEAMYTVSTYIKFNTPIPIKPLVSSIAKGLRNVISVQEAKLFKSRTTTADSVKDTLNLYSCIYVYAVLCGMMITNPNKMLFGRDKPDADISKPKYEKQQKIERPTPKEQSEYVAVNNKIDTGADSTVEDMVKKIGASEYTDSTVEDMVKKIGASEYTDHQASEIPKFQSSGGASKPSAKRLADRKLRRRKIQKRYAGGKTTKDIKLYERFILTTALNLILVTKDSIIKRLVYINTDVIKQIFLKSAYPWAKKHSKPIKMNKDNENRLADTTQNIVDMDAFYPYLYYAKRLEFNSGSVKTAPAGLGAVYNILGRSIEKVSEDLKGGIGLYTTIKTPSKWDFGDPLLDSYSYNSFKAELDYQKQEIYLKPFVPRHMQVQQYYDDNKNVMEEEKMYHAVLAKRVVRPMFEFELLNDIRGVLNDYRPEKLDLASHYCPNGKRHVSGSYIYKTRSNKEVEYTSKEINEWIKSKNTEKLASFAGLKLVDEKCSNCKKHIRSATSNQRSDTSLNTMFDKLDDILAFYQYYVTRCPEGDLHDIQSNICGKCKLKTNIVHDTVDAYYNKYIDKFKKIELEKQVLSIKSLNQAQYENIESDKFAANLKPGKPILYKTTLQKIAKWSQLADIKYNIITNIGLTEGVKIKDIQSGQINPSKTELSDGAYTTQSIKLKNYILHIIRDYNMIMNHENIVGLPLYLKEIITLQKKVNTTDLHKAMPQFGSEFNKLDTTYKYSIDIKSYANFLLEYLASIMVRIDSDSSKNYKLMSKMLIQHFTKNIIQKDALFSKADSFFSKKPKSVADDNLTDDAISGDEYTGYKTDESIGEFSDDKTEHYKNEIVNFADAYDVENAADVWDIN
jgi:hypothetical protein